MSKVGQQAGELSQQGETGIWTEVKKKDWHFSNLGILGDDWEEMGSSSKKKKEKKKDFQVYILTPFIFHYIDAKKLYNF